MTARKNSPVFVVGCHRSGTALLYDSLLSAGGFPLYHQAPYVHSSFLRLCGHPSLRRNREKLLELWLRSKPFRKTGFSAGDLSPRILQECKTGGDFLQITMGELARRAGVQRWAVHDGDNIMHMATIKREIPDALFVHIVRDGRDAALSLMKQGEYLGNPLGWTRRRALFIWALLWQWTVRKGRRYGRQIPADYIEVHYEDLVNHPEQTLTTLGRFLDHDLDYCRIQKNAKGVVASSNTVWKQEAGAETFGPVDRWKTKLSQPEIGTLEGLIGDCLEEFGYQLTTEHPSFLHLDLTSKLMRVLYPQFFNIKLFLHSKTVVGRFGKGALRLELSDPV